MPVIARLSRRFYEVVGEDVTQQLVDWLNAVEEEMTRRASLRVQRASYYPRPEVKLKTSFVGRPGYPCLAEAHPSLRQDFADVISELRRFRSDMIWWMFLYSLGTLLGTAGLLVLLR